MAYQNVGTPRFYIDNVTYLKSIGFNFRTWYQAYGYTQDALYAKYVYDDPDIFTFQPEIQKHLFHKGYNTDGWDGTENYLYWDIPTGYPNGTDFQADNIGFFVAILNHNIATKGLDPYFERTDYIAGTTDGGIESTILNYDPSNLTPNDGCTIFETTNINCTKEKGIYRVAFGDHPNGGATDIKGALLSGVYYDMPHSPELDVTMTIENDGYDAITTQGGAHLNNIRYDGAPMWERVDGTQVPPWTIGEPTTVGRRRGRRVWSMNFKYLSEKDLFASNYMSNTYAENLDGYADGDKDLLNLGAELLTTTNLGSLTNGVMSAGTTEAGWTHHATHDYDSATRVDTGVTIVSDGTSDGVGDEFQSFHSNAFSVTQDTQYQVEYNITVNSGSLSYVVVISSPVGSNVGYNSGSLSAGTHVISELFTATTTDTSSHLEFFTIGSRAVNFTIHSASVRPTNPSDFYYTLDDDDSFHAQVLNKIGNGQRFIFQPDNTNNNPDQFAICQLDQDSLEIKQVANSVYDISLKIKEVW